MSMRPRGEHHGGAELTAPSGVIAGRCARSWRSVFITDSEQVSNRWGTPRIRCVARADYSQPLQSVRHPSSTTTPRGQLCKCYPNSCRRTRPPDFSRPRTQQLSSPPDALVVVAHSSASRGAWASRPATQCATLRPLSACLHCPATAPNSARQAGCLHELSIQMRLQTHG